MNDITQDAKKIIIQQLYAIVLKNKSLSKPNYLYTYRLHIITSYIIIARRINHVA